MAEKEEKLRISIRVFKSDFDALADAGIEKAPFIRGLLRVAVRNIKVKEEDISLDMEIEDGN